MDQPVWRKIQIDGMVSFYGLHLAIQSAFDWSDSHLHEFEMKKMDGQSGLSYRMQMDENIYDELVFDEDDTFVETLEPLESWFMKEKDKAIYTYDFGDDWRHEIVLEKIICSNERLMVPVCTAAKRYAPEEDSWEEEMADAAAPKQKELVKEINNKLTAVFTTIDSDSIFAPFYETFLLNIELKYLPLPIRRVVQLPEMFSIAELHQVIQVVFLWNDQYPYEFEITRQNGVDITPKPIPTIDEKVDIFNEWDIFSENEMSLTLEEVFQKDGDRLLYTYKHPSNWKAEVTLIEKNSNYEDKEPLEHPICVSAENLAPSESDDRKSILSGKVDLKSANSKKIVNEINEAFEEIYADFNERGLELISEMIEEIKNKEEFKSVRESKDFMELDDVFNLLLGLSEEEDDDDLF